MDHGSITQFAVKLRQSGESHLGICTVFIHILLLVHVMFEERIALPLRHSDMLKYLCSAFSLYLHGIVTRVHTLEAVSGRRLAPGRV